MPDATRPGSVAGMTIGQIQYIIVPQIKAKKVIATRSNSN